MIQSSGPPPTGEGALPSHATAAHRHRAEAAALRLDRAHGYSTRIAAFERYRWRAEEDRPQLHLEDVTGIPFLDGIPGVQEYQHRARVRAGDGDLFAAGTAPADGYEAYCRQLGLGHPTLLPVDGGSNPMAVARACAQPAPLEQLARVARERDGLTVHPYMGIEDVWRLAAAIGDASGGAPVDVLAPPPPVTWLANDKDLLTQAVTHALGDDWNVGTARARTVDALAELLGRFAEAHPRVGLKRTRCASAMGNEVHDSGALRGLGPSDRRALVERFLQRTQWCGTEEVLVVVWEDTPHSPSAQLWIPPAESGAPVRLDGLYDQILSGPERVFVGSRPSTLPAPVQRALADSALTIATVFQQLGYVGRCSFDYIVVGDVHDAFRVRFTECNGRWGGTSTPMRLLDRLVPGPRPFYIAQGFAHPALAGHPFAALVEAVGDALFDPSSGRGRFIFYNPGPMRTKGKLDVLALGPDAAEALAHELPARVARLGPS